MKPTVPVPETHRDLLARPIPVVLATMGPGGFPRARPAWCEFDGSRVAILAAHGSAEARDVADRPVATLLAVDPDDTSRWIEVRGDAEVTAEGATELADRLTRLCTPHDPDHGGPIFAHQEDRSAPAVLRIRPTRVNLDAIHR